MYINKHIELTGFTSASTGLYSPKDYFSRSTFYGEKVIAITDSTCLAWPQLQLEAEKKDIKVIYGFSFRLILPENIQIEMCHVICFAKNKRGLDNIIKLMNSCEKFSIDYKIFDKYKENLIIGFELFLDYIATETMITFDKIIEHFLKPDFINVIPHVTQNKSFKFVQEIANKNKILICAVNDSLHGITIDEPNYCEKNEYQSVKDQVLIDEFNFLNENDRYEFVVTNPQKVADMAEKIKFNWNIKICMEKDRKKLALENPDCNILKTGMVERLGTIKAMEYVNVCDYQLSVIRDIITGFAPFYENCYAIVYKDNVVPIKKINGEDFLYFDIDDVVKFLIK